MFSHLKIALNLVRRSVDNDFGSLTFTLFQFKLKYKE
jgi:hypothetical protein